MRLRGFPLSPRTPLFSSKTKHIYICICTYICVYMLQPRLNMTTCLGFTVVFRTITV
jgi:hypothetical protein